MLMEQLKLIKKELGLERDDKEALTAKFAERIADVEMPEEARCTPYDATPPYHATSPYHAAAPYHATPPYAREGI